MSGIAQGLPQRMTAFVDPKTGLVSDSWWRFLNSLWQRTGGAQPTTPTDDVIAYTQMADEPEPALPEPGALLAFIMEDTPQPEPVFLDPMAETVPPVDADQIALLAQAIDDTQSPPENDPALIAMMVAD